MTVNIGNIQKLTSPNPFGLVSSLKENGETNLMAISWWTYVSNRPATIVISVSKKGYTNELIRRQGEFVLNIVDESLKEAAFLCGTCSGRTENKAEKFQVELIESTQVSAKRVRRSKVSLECKVISFIEVSDHDLILAEVVETHFETDLKHLYALDGYSTLGIV